MKIEVLCTFLHEQARFEVGDMRTVSDELGSYFINNGWARDIAAPTEVAVGATEDVTLVVDSTILTAGDSNG